MPFNPFTLLILLSVILAAISQILLKLGSQKQYKSVIREYLNPYVICGYGLLMTTTILNVVAYSKGVELKSGAIIESLGIVIIMALSRLLFGEHISSKKLLGTAVIIVGIIVFYL